MQEEDGIPAVADFSEPFMPDGSQAGPLPQKDSSRSFPPGPGPPPSGPPPSRPPQNTVY